MRFWRAERGNGLAYGVLATALMILVVGALYDVYAAYHYRTWGYQAAGEAASDNQHGFVGAIDGAHPLPLIEQVVVEVTAKALLGTDQDAYFGVGRRQVGEAGVPGDEAGGGGFDARHRAMLRGKEWMAKPQMAG